MPLQVSVHASGKKCLIHDESFLNDFVEKGKFKIESWEEMFSSCFDANFGIQFDMKKFYYEVDIDEDFQPYFGFMFPLHSDEPSYFVWTVLPYGYTRAPYIAKSLMKPLISKWRALGIPVVVFVDDGFAVNKDKTITKNIFTNTM